MILVGERYDVADKHEFEYEVMTSVVGSIIRSAVLLLIWKNKL